MWGSCLWYFGTIFYLMICLFRLYLSNSCYIHSVDGVMRTMSTEKLLKTIPIIQNQMDALLDFNVSLRWSLPAARLIKSACVECADCQMPRVSSPTRSWVLCYNGGEKMAVKLLCKLCWLLFFRSMPTSWLMASSMPHSCSFSKTPSGFLLLITKALSTCSVSSVLTNNFLPVCSSSDMFLNL